jgi:hypothetical protein
LGAYVFPPENSLWRNNPNMRRKKREKVKEKSPIETEQEGRKEGKEGRKKIRAEEQSKGLLPLLEPRMGTKPATTERTPPSWEHAFLLQRTAWRNNPNMRRKKREKVKEKSPIETEQEGRKKIRAEEQAISKYFGRLTAPSTRLATRMAMPSLPWNFSKSDSSD